jgi:hypothetical protein
MAWTPRRLAGGHPVPPAPAAVQSVRPVTHVHPDTGQVERTKVSRTGSRSCRCGKQAYTSKKLAKAVAVAQSKASGDQIEAYHCYIGHCFHIGHVPGSVRRAS